MTSTTPQPRLNWRSLGAMVFIYPSYLATVLAASQTCPVDSPVSCHASGSVDNTCCYNTPGGLILQTQFWDTNPATGPDDSWTVHGLWPDNCDGTYDANCDPSREYSNISDILQAHNKNDLLGYMKTYWKDYQGDDETFWSHEWNKHGTCMSTFETKCYDNYQPQDEVADFFQKTVDLFKTLNTYKTLSDAGITPDSSKTYSLSDLQNAVSKSFGMEVTLNCKNGELNEIWYFFNVKGSAQTGQYIPTQPGGTPSTCPDTGVKYLPKSGGSGGGGGDGGDPPPSGSFSGKGYLEVTTGGSQKGCVISAGTWYTTGTCATYTAATSGDGFTLTSSKGPCGIANEKFTCGSGVTAGTFTAVNGHLAVNGAHTFYADSVPSGTTQVPIYTSKHATELTIGWKSA